MRSISLTPLSKKIPPVGVGGIVIDPPNPTWVTKLDFPKILDLAVDKLGIRYIDTAMAYGIAEVVIGDWLQARDRPYDLLIGSKTVGPTEKGAKFNSEFTRQRLQQSLNNLKIGVLDIYWMHGPHDGTSIEDTVQGFAEAVGSDLAKTYGLCNVTAEQIEKALAHLSRLNLPLPSAIQNEFSLLTQASQAAVIKLCNQHGISFVAFSPLASGMLAGRYQWNQPPPPNSRWDSWSKRRAYPDYWSEKGFAAVNRFAQMAKEMNATSAALALAWMFHNPDITVTLLGPRTPAQMESSGLALQLELSPAQCKSIQEIFKEF
jgi:aryl-alcohol dehydrogenase-like predicted oxidoreductase